LDPLYRYHCLNEPSSQTNSLLYSSSFSITDVQQSRTPKPFMLSCKKIVIERLHHGDMFEVQTSMLLISYSPPEDMQATIPEDEAIKAIRQ
ncbi:5611_t:CDS:1, partial [Racocetra persica]